LASIIIFGNPENKKEISIFGSFFLLTIFSTYFVFGIGIFGSEEIFKLAGFFSVLLGVAVLFSGIFVLRRYWKKWKMMEGFESEIKKIVPRKFKEAFTVVWIFIKRNIQRMNLSIAAILIGFASSGFLFPCIEKPYGIFVNSLASKDKIIESILTVALYNLIFIIPTLIFSGIIYWFAHTQKLEIFRTKHDKLIRIIVGIGLLFAGSYFIYSNCF
jgi:cytochrome c biogenesis protein CcdA